MNCPNCNFIINNKMHCSNCGENPYLLVKSINNSIILYNNALVKSNLRDFSGAIVLCKKSISFDKSNIEARNLLGLLYYKLGRMGDALKQWILSTNFDENEKENKAFGYISKFQNNLREHEKLNDAVTLYNEAIEYLRARNDDLAIIRLKKALETNPTFIDAINLLAFCYIIQKKYKNASALLDVVLNIDANNYIAKKYILEIDNNTTKKGIIDKTLIEGYYSNGSVLMLDEDNPKKNKIKSSSHGFLAFITGGIIMSLFMYYLIIPELNEMRVSSLEDLNNSTQLELASNNEILIDKNIQIEMLQAELISASNKINYYANKDILLHSTTLLEKGQVEDAQIVFGRIDITNFDEALLVEYNALKAKLNL